MQNVQNAAEIQQRVINLVELYRTKVGKESQIAKEAKADCEYWDKESVDMMMEEGLAVGGGMYGEGPHTEAWIKHLQVNEQLLGHFYAEVAGESAKKDVLAWLLPDVYDKTIFTDEEESFLKTHFKEMVNYIILTPCDDSLEWVHRHDGKDAFTIPAEVLELIKTRVEIAAGSKVFYPNTCFAQLANLFDGCTFYCDTMPYAWTKIALYANGIKAEDNEKPSSFDAIISYLPKDSDNSKDIARLCDSYKYLPVNGKLVLLCPSGILAGTDNISHKMKLSETLKFKELDSVRKELDEEEASSNANARFREMLVEDNAIKEIIQLPQVMSNNASFDTYCLLVAEKGQSSHETILVDARSASDELDNKHYMLSFSNDKFNAIINNDGKDPGTGLRKVVKETSDNLSKDILLPQVYTIERPSSAESPVPLATLCSLESTLVRDVQYDLPEDTPWITMNDITPLFTGNVDMNGVRKAECPNNPVYVEGSKDYAFDKEGKFVDSIWVQMNTKKGHHVLDYRQCTFLEGNNDVVLYDNGRSAKLVLKKRSAEHGVRVAVVRATDKPFAVSSGILVFRPKNGFDAKSLAAILRLPIVYRQLLAYEQFGIGIHLDEILVPTDKRIIGDELYRMEREKSVTDELGDRVQTMKTEYINEVRMRKHDMRPHLRQLASSERLMLHYIEESSDLEELKKHMCSQLVYTHEALTSLSTIVDHLSNEDKFGKPELLNLNKLLEEIEVNHDDSEGFAIEYDCDRESFNRAGFVLPDLIEQWEKANGQGVDMKQFIQSLTKENLPLFVEIAPVDFQRLVTNIIDNARNHGFTDNTRTDYYIGIDLSYDAEREMYQIDFSNNGNPLPNGMTKERYGIRGEKAGEHGGTGNGGYIIKSIVSHYGGDFDVLTKDGITIIRIFLPTNK